VRAIVHPFATRLVKRILEVSPGLVEALPDVLRSRWCPGNIVGKKFQRNTLAEARVLVKLSLLLGRMTEKDRHLLFYAVQRMDSRRRLRIIKKKR
jgi:hypothetical protein